MGSRVRPCLTCGAPAQGPYCWAHTKPRVYNDAVYKQQRRSVLATATGCAICGQPGTHLDPLEADHIIPISDGGHARGPLRAVHRSCNARRGALRQAGRMTA